MDFDLGTAPAPPAAPPPPPGYASPIADLSYRNYDGPFKPRMIRWWIVALATVRLAFKSTAYWIIFTICILRYILECGSVYITAQLQQQITDPTAQQMIREKFSHHFFSALCGSMNSYAILCLALVVGAGCIAADNRTNALMVYLSKPITKGDYLLGKWMGVFLSIYFATLIPALILYVFCLAGYVSAGFLKEDPWLFLRMPAACAVPAAIHASVLVGISAWSKTPRTAGAAYAGLYFISYTIAGIILGRIFYQLAPATLDLLTHSSISGAIDGLVQRAYDVKSLDIPWFGQVAGQRQRGGGDGRLVNPPPALWFTLTLGFTLAALGIAAARARIRAVEVVRG